MCYLGLERGFSTIYTLVDTSVVSAAQALCGRKTQIKCFKNTGTLLLSKPLTCVLVYLFINYIQNYLLYMQVHLQSRDKGIIYDGPPLLQNKMPESV